YWWTTFSIMLFGALVVVAIGFYPSPVPAGKEGYERNISPEKSADRISGRRIKELLVTPAHIRKEDVAPAEGPALSGGEEPAPPASVNTAQGKEEIPLSLPGKTEGAEEYFAVTALHLKA